MKTRNLFFQVVMLSAMALVCSQTLNSCKDEDPETTISEVVNVAPVENLKSDLLKATTLTDLPADIKAAAPTITTVIDNNELLTFSNANLDEVILFYQTNITLTADEITALKNNDPYTYDKVINRMMKMPPFISADEISNHYDAMLKNSTFSELLIKDPGVVKDLYAVNCYQGVLDLQKYITDYTIPMLQKINALKNDALKSAVIVAGTNEFTVEEMQMISTLLNLVLANTNSINTVYLNSQQAQHEGGSAS